MPKQKGKFNRTHEHGKPIGKGDRKARREAVASFTDPLTPKTFKKELKAATRLQFRPQARELQAETRAEKEFRDRAKDYFTTYGEAVKKAQTSTAGSYDDAYAKANTQAETSSANDEALRSKIEAEAKADAERRGATYTPSSTSTEASANRRDSAGLMASLISAQGATQGSYLADKKRIGAGEKRDQLVKSHARQRSLNQEKKDLAKAKGDFATDFTSRTREAERQYALENLQLQLSRKGQKLSAKTSRRNAALSAATQRRQQDLSAASQAATRAETRRHNLETEQASRRDDRRDRRQDRYDRNHPDRGDGGDGNNVQNAVAKLRVYGNTLDRKEREGFTRQDAIDYLVAQGYPRAIAVKAVERLVGGGGGPSVADRY